MRSRWAVIACLACAAVPARADRSPPSPSQALAERTADAEKVFFAALQNEVSLCLEREVVTRLRRHADFLPKFPGLDAVVFRGRWEKAAAQLVAELKQKLDDLRVFYAANDKPVEESRAGLDKVMAELPARIKKILNSLFLPADDKSYQGLDQKYRVEYSPSTQLVWAWLRIRGLDAAALHLKNAAKAASPLPVPLEVRFYAPETLPPPERKKPTP